MKKLGIIILMILCVILLIAKWILWLPYMFFVFPFTGCFMHEHEFVMLPTYWLLILNEKYSE